MVSEKDIIKINLVEYRDELNFAFKTAKLKANKDNTQNTWQSERSSFRKFTDLFPGDLAKNVVRRFFDAKSITLIDYDKIRTDNFEQHDLFDLKHNELVIEVKSSVEKTSNFLNDIIKKRRIIIYPNKRLSEIIIQVFYLFKDDSCKSFLNDMEKLAEDLFKEKYHIHDETDFTRKFVACSPEAFIMGYVTKEVATTRMKNIFTYTNSEDKHDHHRDYIDFLIQDANPISSLVTAFLS